jgi:hypothetical protein
MTEPRRGVVPGFEDLADPTPATVQFAAERLVHRLRGRRPGGPRECGDPDQFQAAIDAALGHLGQLVDRLAEHRRVDDDALLMVLDAADAVEAAQRLCVNRLSFVMAGDQADAWELVRTAYAVYQGRCVMGQRDPQPCSPGPERVRMRVDDEGGGSHWLDQSCITHAGQEWARWDHRQVDLVIVGPPAAAKAVRELGAARQRGEGGEPC